MWSETAGRSGGKNCAIIFDEINRIPNGIIYAIIKIFMDAGIFVCVCLNPMYEGR